MMAAMNLDTSAHILNAQSDRKVAEIEEIIYFDYQHSNKQWSNYPTSP